MKTRPYSRIFAALIICVLVVVPAAGAMAAPYAAMVMDARSGEVIHSRNADTRLHPASLTKMMTLYVAFDAIRRGEISLDTMVTISRNAAAEPPSKLGLRAGQKIQLRYLIRAAAVRSANDAATAIGEAISGSEAAFAARMTATAKALGMNDTTFKNAHGLTAAGHLSTARDMTVLGRRLFYDWPQYYNIFSRQSTDAGVANVQNTKRRFLADYRGADGIKTGYTRAAGFNLVASAERGNKRIIATVFGGTSTAQRNRQVAELLDIGFQRAPNNVPVSRPAAPQIALAQAAASAPAAVRSVAAAVNRSPRPAARPIAVAAVPTQEVIAAITDNIAEILDEVVVAEAVAEVVTASSSDDPMDEEGTTTSALAPVATLVPQARPEEPEPPVAVAAADPVAVEPELMMAAVAAPPPRPTETAEVVASEVEVLAALTDEMTEEGDMPEVVTRVSSSGGRYWGVTVGSYNSRHEAERMLLRTALAEASALDGALRRVVPASGGFQANFVGLSREQADLACRRLQARGTTCFSLSP